MQGLHDQLAETASRSESLQRMIDAADAEIDRLVYELYGLNAEEVAIVEGQDGAPEH